jgi:Fe-S oxidoreductase
MATYKSEFLSHYYEKHHRPVTAYAFGLVHYWARLGSVAPAITNFLTHAPGLAGLMKLASGMSVKRRVPAFAPFTFKQWWDGRAPRTRPSGERVILWPDTFNNHFYPRTAINAVRALERAGFTVDVPHAPVCCGRPLYDYGMLDTAKSWLQHVMVTLGDDIRAGTPIVGLEPSCVAVFRDELTELFPSSEDAKRLARQTFLLSEFLDREHVRLPTLHRRAIVHGHCHHKALMKMDAEAHVLDAIGLDYQLLGAGCCGMAGSVGFERDHYDVSMKVGERVLLPAVRAAAPDDLIIADGFSCRTQIRQATERRALHLADVLEMAARDGVDGPAGEYPERGYVPTYGTPAAPVAAGAIAGFALGIGAVALMRRRAMNGVERPA